MELILLIGLSRIPKLLIISLSISLASCSDKILVSSDSISFPYGDTVLSLSTTIPLTLYSFTNNFSENYIICFQYKGIFYPHHHSSVGFEPQYLFYPMSHLNSF